MKKSWWKKKDLLNQFKYYLSNNDKLFSMKKKWKFLKEQRELLWFNIVFLKDYKERYKKYIIKASKENIGTLWRILSIPHSYIFWIVILWLFFQQLSGFLFWESVTPFTKSVTPFISSDYIRNTNNLEFLVSHFSDICLWILLALAFIKIFYSHFNLVTQKINKIIELNSEDNTNYNELDNIEKEIKVINNKKYKKKDKDEIKTPIKIFAFLFWQPFIFVHWIEFWWFSFEFLLILDILIFLIIFNILSFIIKYFIKIEVEIIYWFMMNWKLITITRLDYYLDKLVIQINELQKDLEETRKWEVVKIYKWAQSSIHLLGIVTKIINKNNIKNNIFNNFIKDLLLEIILKIEEIMLLAKENIKNTAKNYSITTDLDEIDNQLRILKDKKELFIQQ